MSSLSLFDIEAGLHELFDAWQEAQTPEALEAAEAAIQAYAFAEVAKVDGVRRYIRACEAQSKAALDEAKIQNERAAMWVSRRDRLKTLVFDVMKAFGRQKLEGSTGAFRIQGNGGKQPVVIADESLIPDEFCSVAVRFRVNEWRRAQVILQLAVAYEAGPRTPSLSLIAAELEKACERCDGAPAVGTKDECQWCGGSGKRGVPGARLEARGEHLRIS